MCYRLSTAANVSINNVIYNNYYYILYISVSLMTTHAD